MTVGLSPPMFLQFFVPNNSGAPAQGYKLFTYQAGTSIKQATWTDSTQTTQNANPYILDANGRASLWIDPSLSYKYVVAPPNDTDPPSSPIWSQDNITGSGTINVPGTYNPTFGSGNVLYKGPNGLNTNGNLIFGTNIPNPSGINSAALLLGSGGGGGNAIRAWLLSDQAYDNFTPGNTLGITAGETQSAGSANGGPLLIYGGASFAGTGGELLLQGGTSFNGNGGQTILHGANSTNGVPGDVFVEAGETGTQGANVHLIATKLNGVAGDVRIRNNSTVLVQFLSNGEILLTNSGTSVGTAGQSLVSQGLGAAAKWSGGGTRSSPGYEIFPDGLMIQWGGGTVNTNTAITFPIAFTTACWAVTFSPINTTNQLYLTGNPTTTGFTITNGTAASILWQAVGY